jgi:hypothetical protein
MYESRHGAYDAMNGTLESHHSSQHYGVHGRAMPVAGGHAPPGGWYDTDL